MTKSMSWKNKGNDLLPLFEVVSPSKLHAEAILAERKLIVSDIELLMLDGIGYECAG